jgi:hypothetical protein
MVVGPMPSPWMTAPCPSFNPKMVRSASHWVALVFVRSDGEFDGVNGSSVRLGARTVREQPLHPVFISDVVCCSASFYVQWSPAAPMISRGAQNICKVLQHNPNMVPDAAPGGGLKSHRAQARHTSWARSTFGPRGRRGLPEERPNAPKQHAFQFETKNPPSSAEIQHQGAAVCRRRRLRYANMIIHIYVHFYTHWPSWYLQEYTHTTHNIQHFSTPQLMSTQVFRV